MGVVIMALKMNIHTLSGSHPFAVLAKASTLMNCKIQALCVKTNISVSFTPPEAMDEDSVKMLYYHHQNFTMCQRVREIRMNEANNDSSKQMEPDFSEVLTKGMYSQLARDYYLVYGYNYSHCIYEVDTFISLSVSQKFEKWFEKIPHNSSVVFILNPGVAPFVSFFVKALLQHLGRKTPIDANYDPDIVQTWLSSNEPRRDLIACSSTLNHMKAKFIINLSDYSTSYEQVSAARNATSHYTYIYLPFPSRDEHEAMAFYSSEENKQSDEAYSMLRNNMEKYLRRTDV